eukprot:2164523-Rhodomonas_salina.3
MTTPYATTVQYSPYGATHTVQNNQYGAMHTGARSIPGRTHSGPHTQTNAHRIAQQKQPTIRHHEIKCNLPQSLDFEVEDNVEKKTHLRNQRQANASDSRGVSIPVAVGVDGLENFDARLGPNERLSDLRRHRPKGSVRQARDSIDPQAVSDRAGPRLSSVGSQHSCGGWAKIAWRVWCGRGCVACQVRKGCAIEGEDEMGGQERRGGTRQTGRASTKIGREGQNRERTGDETGRAARSREQDSERGCEEQKTASKDSKRDTSEKERQDRDIGRQDRTLAKEGWSADLEAIEEGFYVEAARLVALDHLFPHPVSTVFSEPAGSESAIPYLQSRKRLGATGIARRRR